MKNNKNSVLFYPKKSSFRDYIGIIIPILLACFSIYIFANFVSYYHDLIKNGGIQMDNYIYVITYLFFGSIFLLLYFFPSICGKDKNNKWAIFVFNLFLGWTFIGWVIALVWALTKDNKPIIIDQKKDIKQSSVEEQIEELVRLRNKDYITEDEFCKKKAQILGLWNEKV